MTKEFKRYALFSVYDKSNLENLAQDVISTGRQIIASGSTYSYLKSNGIEAVLLSDFTGQPERFDGRIKTLHHKIYGSLLIRENQPVDIEEWEDHGSIIDLVVCNCYPFEEKTQDLKDVDQITEWIDIGGPTMIRAAAKNFEYVSVLCHSQDYSSWLLNYKQKIYRQELAAKAFQYIFHYDCAILEKHLNFSKNSNLKYGENPHQQAHLLAFKSNQSYENLGYNNILDADAAWRCVKQFNNKQFAVSVVKHQTLCGAAVSLAPISGDDDWSVFEHAWEGDTVSRYGGIVAFNQTPSQKVLEFLEKKFVEVIVLPDNEATQLIKLSFETKKSRRKIILMPKNAKNKRYELKKSTLGYLFQQEDLVDSNQDYFLFFSQVVVANSKSNAMALIGKNDKFAYLAGVGQGQPNRVEALSRLAIPRAQDFCQRMKIAFKELYCVSDAFLPFADSIEVLKEQGIQHLIQPGGSKNDEIVDQAAREAQVEQTLTGVRHFWH